MEVGDDTCDITVTARGGPVTWSVVSAQGVTASGGGTLPKNGRTTVTATREGLCDSGGSGTVTFSPSGTATVTWKCL